MKFPRQVVLEPRDIWWERHGVINPAVVELGGKVHLLYRAVGHDHISRFGLAISEDGEAFARFDQPIFEGDPNNPAERLGVEDPRATVVGRDIFIIYTAVSVYPAGQISSASSLNNSGTPWRVRVSALKTRDMRTFARLGVILPELDSRDAVLIPQKHLGFYWLIHRVSPSIFIARSRDMRKWEGNIEMMTGKESWEAKIIGAACPPIEINEGWLLLYYGVSSSHVYSLGATLLAKENPAVVLKRTKHPIMSPYFDWERRGEASNVIFPTGIIVKHGKVHLYYGGAGKVVALAKIPLESIISSLNG